MTSAAGRQRDKATGNSLMLPLFLNFNSKACTRKNLHQEDIRRLKANKKKIHKR